MTARRTTTADTPAEKTAVKKATTKKAATKKVATAKAAPRTAAVAVSSSSANGEVSSSSAAAAPTSAARRPAREHSDRDPRSDAALGASVSAGGESQAPPTATRNAGSSVAADGREPRRESSDRGEPERAANGTSNGATPEGGNSDPRRSGRRRSRRSRGRRRGGANRDQGGGGARNEDGSPMRADDSGREQSRERGGGRSGDGGGGRSRDGGRGRGDGRNRSRGGRGRGRGGRDASARAPAPEPVKKKVVRRKVSPAVSAPSAAVTAERRETLTVEQAAAQLGIEQLHSEQERVITETLAGNDVVMIVPTGFGKSACYQLPSMLLPKPVVVISPLLALLEDQHRKLIEHDVPVVRLDGGVRGKRRTEALDRIEEGGSLLILTTPETLANPLVMERLQKSGVSLVAIDEAHCISEWGYDFRPAYQRIGAQLRALGEPPILALTATATEHVREAIVKSLRMREPVVIDVSPHRSNLAFEVLPAEGDVRARVLVRLIKRLRRPGIVYCSTRREVDMIWALLKHFRIPAHRYHGGMTSLERETEQQRYMRRGHRTVMIATNAFGLGIDKPDIRYVLHYQSPASLEQYVQEAGRGGRDGKKANCILLYDPADREIHQALLNRSRIRPDQLFKLGAALEAWNDEQRSPTLEALALSAELGPRITQALLTKIEEAGFVDCDGSEIEVIDRSRSIEEDTRSLAGQFERLRREDSRRLDLIGDYAGHAECRAQFLQSYFGEASDEECGLCDVCRGKPTRPTAFFAPLALPKNDGSNKKKRPASRGGDNKRGGRKRSRGGRRRRGGRPGGGDGGSGGGAGASSD